MRARASLLLVGILVLSGCAAPLPGLTRSEDVEDRSALVLSSHRLAAEAGAEMLRRGGNAIDAAVAVQMALTVVQPHFSGIGGGTFLLAYNATTGDVLALDGRETAPAAATPDMFLLPTGEPMDFQLAHQMGFAVGTPGTVRLWHDAWERGGSLPWSTLFEPAIGYAEGGFAVDAELNGLLLDANTSQKLRAWPASARTFYKDAVCSPSIPLYAPLVGPEACVATLPHEVGDILRQPDLAATLRLLAEQGPDAFYTGPMAEAIVATTSSRQGRLTMEDLAGYAAVEREPVRLEVDGRELVSMPPPASGPFVLQFLAIMEGFRTTEHDAVDTLHLEIEALRRVYADRRAYLADPAYVDVPLDGLLHPDYIAERRADIDPTRAKDAGPGDPWRYQDGDGEPGTLEGEGNHTSHFVVIDHAGNIVTATSSIEAAFGSGMVVPGYGFLLNNHNTDFDLVPGGPNQVEGGKRPRSAQSPTLAFEDGEPILALGASGSARIMGVVAQVSLHALSHGEPVEHAVAGPRVMPLDFPTVRWDMTLPADVREALEARGHDMEDRSRSMAITQAALKVDGRWTGVADPRGVAGGTVRVPAPEGNG